MAYYSVEDAVNTFLERYPNLSTAILKAQVRKNTASSKVKHDFWLEVETQLKQLKPKKKGKWEQEETE